MKLSEITPNAKNPRLIKEERFKKLVTSLENLPDFTAIRSIILDEDKNIIGGNMRYRAMKHLGWKTAIVQVYDREYHAETKAALELGKSYEDVCREMVIRDNVAFGEHDFDILANEYDPLELDEWGLDVWQPEEEEEVAGLTDPDEVPEAPEEPKTKLGDLYILGEHRLLCGNSTKAEDVENLMNGEKADMAFTSPPYNSGNGGYRTDYNGKLSKFYNQDSDDRTEVEWVHFCNKVLNLCRVNMTNKESPIIWNVMYTARCRKGYGESLFCGSHGLKVHETICWDKGHGFPTASGGILSRNWELIFVLSEGDKYNTTQGKNEVRWAKWDISRPQQQETHKATFPIQLAERAISDFSHKGVIFDPFLGSGTTLIAAEKTGRKCYGMELDPKYCDVIVKRWEHFTGKKAELWKP
jgi:DNA modification methylase